mgnify:CR=1 FL=1
MKKVAVAFVLGMIAGAYTLAMILNPAIKRANEALHRYNDELDKGIASNMEEIERLLKENKMEKER